VRAAFHLPGSFESRDAETLLLWEAGCRGLEERDGAVIAYFDEQVELPLAGEWRGVDEVDWLAKYYAELKPLRSGRLLVSPTHCLVEAGPGERLLRLDPGMAFGTGHHLTTQLALRALEALELAGKAVLDVGSGSGILAIAADLLGAEDALGIDIDPATVSVARSNRALNRSAARFREGVLDSGVADASADVVVANLFAELHAELAPDYRRVLRPGGVLLATGILEARLGLVLNALGEHFSEVASEPQDGWALVTARP
jgi:ribosomal protein L11 methyltransferase